jgi:preprotein translocase subunit SecG
LLRLLLLLLLLLMLLLLLLLLLVRTDHANGSGAVHAKSMLKMCSKRDELN